MRVSGENHIVVGKLSLDRFRYEVRIQKREIRLTRMEFTLLWTLASQAGKVFRREELLDQLWGPGRFVEPRTVDVHVTRLRRKLQAHWRSPTVVIETVWGVGYRLRNSHSSSHIAAHRPAASVPGVHPGRLRSSKVLSDTHREEDGSEDFTEL
jgi:DNA-binding response OmpR family regulator